MSHLYFVMKKRDQSLHVGQPDVRVAVPQLEPKLNLALILEPKLVLNLVLNHGAELELNLVLNHGPKLVQLVHKMTILAAFDCKIVQGQGQPEVVLTLLQQVDPLLTLLQQADPLLILLQQADQVLDLHAALIPLVEVVLLWTILMIQSRSLQKNLHEGTLVLPGLEKIVGPESGNLASDDK